MGCLFQQDITNLAKYLDTNNDGMIVVSKAKTAIVGFERKLSSPGK